MSSMRSLLACIILVLIGSTALGQLSPEDLKKQVDARSGNLSGFQELLDDPDPRRSLAAVEGMLGSGDSNLERMALLFALTNPDAAIQATALQHHFAKLPAIAVTFDAADVSEEEMTNLVEVLRATGGTIGPDKKGSFNFQPGAYDEKLGCYPRAENTRYCALRLGTGFVSIYFFAHRVLEGRWVNMHPDESGVLRGGVTFDNRNEAAGTVPLTVRLLH